MWFDRRECSRRFFCDGARSSSPTCARNGARLSPIDADRPQDVDRPHRKRRRISERNRQLLGVYQVTMRAELVALLNTLSERNGSLAERERAWKLAILLAKELGADIEEPTKLHPPAAVTDGPAEAANF